MSSLLEQARDKNYWRQLNPRLSVRDSSNNPPTRIDLDEKELAGAKKSLRTKGYFQIDQVLDVSLVDLLFTGVENVWKNGWPTPFAVVYDQYWQLFHSLEPLFSSILGAEYKLLPNFWCWYIDKTYSSKGWGPHRDRSAVNTLMADGLPATLTVWIPLSDITTMNGCIHVVPADLDPNIPDRLNLIQPDTMQDIRALPANRGAVLAWTEALVNWGGRSSDLAANPHASISFTFQRNDKLPYEVPLFEGAKLPTFEERLGLIGQVIERFNTHEPVSSTMLAACSKMANYIDPLQIPEGSECETLEKDQRLADSVLWHLQEEYFERENIRAWDTDVPVYSTSHAPFCATYAELLLAFLLDHANELNAEHPLFILELGGGTGCFAYRFLNELQERIRDFKSIKNLQLRYILTDFTASIVGKWAHNERLGRHKRAGILDFAVFNPETDSQLRLFDSQDVIASAQIKNPLVVIANYVFDSIRHDAFRTVGGALQETRFTIDRDGTKEPLSSPIRFDQLRTSERYFDVTPPYYDDPALNSILQYYASNLAEASIIFPIGALRATANLLKFSSENLFLLASDKGFTSLNSRQILGLWKQAFATHGSFSFDVNFDAIARYFDARGGVSFVEAGDHQGLCTFAGAVLGNASQSLEHLRCYFHQHMNRKDPINCLRNVEPYIWELKPDGVQEKMLRTLLSIVRVWNFEPALFIVVYDKFFNLVRLDLARLDEQRKDEFVDMLWRVGHNIFQGPDEVLNRAFDFYMALGRYDDGVKLAESMMELFGPACTIFDHLGLFYERKKDYVRALEYFRKSVELNPQHQWAKNEIDKMKELIRISGQSFSMSISGQ